MTATYTFDVFSSLDGFGAASGGNGGKQGPELLARRLALYGAEQRMVFGANTYRAFARMLAPNRRHGRFRKTRRDNPTYSTDAACDHGEALARGCVALRYTNVQGIDDGLPPGCQWILERPEV